MRVNVPRRRLSGSTSRAAGGNISAHRFVVACIHMTSIPPDSAFKSKDDAKAWFREAEGALRSEVGNEELDRLWKTVDLGRHKPKALSTDVLGSSRWEFKRGDGDASQKLTSEEGRAAAGLFLEPMVPGERTDRWVLELGVFFPADSVPSLLPRSGEQVTALRTLLSVSMAPLTSDVRCYPIDPRCLGTPVLLVVEQGLWATVAVDCPGGGARAPAAVGRELAQHFRSLRTLVDVVRGLAARQPEDVRREELLGWAGEFAVWVLRGYAAEWTWAGGRLSSYDFLSTERGYVEVKTSLRMPDWALFTHAEVWSGLEHQTRYAVLRVALPESALDGLAAAFLGVSKNVPDGASQGRTHALPPAAAPPGTREERPGWLAEALDNFQRSLYVRLEAEMRARIERALLELHKTLVDSHQAHSLIEDVGNPFMRPCMRGTAEMMRVLGPRTRFDVLLDPTA